MAINGLGIQNNNPKLAQLKANLHSTFAPKTDTWKDANGVSHSKDTSIFSIANPISIKGGTPTGNNSQLPNLTDNNVFASLNNWKDKAVQTKSTTSSAPTTQNYDASSGRAAASDMEGSTDDVRGQTTLTQNNTTIVTKTGADAIDLKAKTKADDKKFQKLVKQEEKAFRAEQIKLEKAIEEQEATGKIVEDAQNELASLTTGNSMSFGGGSDNSGRITELQDLIGSNVGKLQQNGRTIYSLQRSSARSIKRMNKANVQYIKAQNKNIQATEQQQKETSGILKVAEKIEQYSALVAQGGQLLDMAGQGLIALGGAMSWTGGGAALIAAGKIMSKVGKIANVVGQYGQAAANITKTAAYAAEGNLMGAMQSLGAAVQTGCAAAKSTKSLKKDLQSVNKQADNALNKLAANDAAKQQAEQLKNSKIDELAKDSKNYSNEFKSQKQFLNEKGEFDQSKFDEWYEKNKDDKGALEKALEKGSKTDKRGKNWIDNQAFGGMNEKQFKQATSAELQDMMRNGQITAKHKGNKIKRVNELKQNAGNVAGTAGENAKTNFKSVINDAGGMIDENGKIQNLTNKQIKNINKQAKTSFGKINYTPEKTDWGKHFNTLQQGLTTTAALFGQNENQSMPTVTTKPQRTGSYTMSARALDVIERTNRQRTARARYYGM